MVVSIDDLRLTIEKQSELVVGPPLLASNCDIHWRNSEAEQPIPSCFSIVNRESSIVNPFMEAICLD
jgi:hypothetical protein